jgi:hypothetical protein
MLQSRREQILDKSLDRLGVISTTAGYATDAGESVHLGEHPPIGPDDPQAGIVVMVGEDAPNVRGNAIFNKLRLAIQGVVKVESLSEIRSAYRKAEAIAADIKRAFELDDRSMGGLVTGLGLERGITRVLDREPGSEYVGVEVEYFAPMKEEWGTP